MWPVRLKSLECSKCGKQCSRAFSGGSFWQPVACQRCKKMVCGRCSHGAHQNPVCCKMEMEQYAILSQLCCFVNAAPRHELKLIDLQVKRSANCDGCNSDRKLLFRYGIQEVRCTKCCGKTTGLWNTASSLEQLYGKIIIELSSYTESVGGEVTEVMKNDLGSPLPLRVSIPCHSCKKLIVRCDKPLTIDGIPFCDKCLSARFLGHRGCECLHKFVNAIHCIPENQLNKLTYANWEAAIVCPQCLIHMGHSKLIFRRYVLGGGCSEVCAPRSIRAFFKGEGGDCENISTQTGEEEYLRGSTLDGSLQNNNALQAQKNQDGKLIPKLITCSCGREDELFNMFDCVTCSCYGLCSLCVTRIHRTHDVCDSAKTVLLNLVKTRSTKTLKTLSDWSAAAIDLGAQSASTYRKLCCVLDVAFKEAAISSDSSQNIDHVEDLMVKSDISSIERQVKGLLVGNAKAIKSINTFCERLEVAINARKPTVLEEMEVLHEEHGQVTLVSSNEDVTTVTAVASTSEESVGRKRGRGAARAVGQEPVKRPRRQKM